VSTREFWLRSDSGMKKRQDKSYEVEELRIEKLHETMMGQVRLSV
jgi:hypothetical protein